VGNRKLNGVKNVKAYPLALDDEITKNALYVAGENIEASSFIPNHITKNPSGSYPIVNSFTVPVVTLDYLLGSLGIRFVDLVKIDVEGFETRVLDGARNALETGSIGRFVIDVHKDVVKTKDVINRLVKYGYVINRVIQFGYVKDIVYAKIVR